MPDDSIEAVEWVPQKDILLELYSQPLDFMHPRRAAGAVAANCPLKDEGGVIDGSYSGLNSSVQTLFKRATEDYQREVNRKFAYICINSGRRSVSKQVDLYRAWRRSEHGGVPAPRANLPGTSKHEYGFAIDVVWRNDETLLSRALTGNGWTQNAGEGWHFDCTGSSRWDALTDYIDKERPKAPTRLGGKIETQILKEVDLLVMRETIAEMGSRLAAQKTALDRQKQALSRQYQKLQKLRQGIDRRTREVANLQRKAEQLRRDYVGFQYTACPNGQPYGQCTHADLIAQYDRQKADKERRWRSADRNYDLEKQSLDNDKAAYQREESAYRTESSAYNASIADYSNQLTIFRAHQQTELRLVDEIAMLQRDVEALITDVQSMVDGF